MKKNPLTFRILLKALAMSGLSIKWMFAIAIDRFGTKTFLFGNQQDAEGWGKDDYIVESFGIVSSVIGNCEIKTNIRVDLTENNKED